MSTNDKFAAILFVCGIGMLACSYLRSKRGSRWVIVLVLLLPSIGRAQQPNLHPTQPGRRYAQIYPADWSPAMCATPSKDMVDGKYIRYCLTFAPKVTPVCPASARAKQNPWKEHKAGFYFEPYDCSWKPFGDPRKEAR